MELDKNEQEILQELLKKKEAPEPNLSIVHSVVCKGHRWRVIWNTLHYRPISETFHEFIIKILLSFLFGEDWRKNEAEKPIENRHILLQWVYSYSDWTKRNMKRVVNYFVDNLLSYPVCPL